MTAVLKQAAAFLHGRRRQSDLRAEFARTRAEVAFLREIPEPPPDAPGALIPCMADWMYGLKTEAMFALALKLAGWRVTFIPPPAADGLAEEFLRAHGFTDFHSWNEFEPDESDYQEIVREAETLLEHAASFPALKQMTADGCWIGPQVLATVSRRLFDTDFDPASPEIRAILRKTVIKCLVTIRAARRLFAAGQPRLLCVNEANYAYHAALVDTAIRKQIAVVQFVQPARDDAFYLWKLRPETRRQHPSTVSRETFEKVTARPWTPAHEQQVEAVLRDRYSGKWFLQQRNQTGTAAKAKAVLVAELQLDPAKKIACVFSHVLWDANLFYGEDLFTDYGDWFVETVKAACRNEGVNWLIKYHPANTWKRARENVTTELAEDVLIRQHVGALPAHVKILKPSCGISTQSLFEAIDCGITVRGTAGIELPCFGVPILTAGTGRYSGLGFSIDSQSREEYLARLADLQNQPPLTPEQVRLARQHAYAAFCLRPWVMKSFRAAFQPARYPGDPLDYNLHPAVAGLPALRAAGDLAQFVAWATQDGLPDFLQEPEPEPAP